MTNDLFQQALEMHRAGRRAEAEAIYSQILASTPNDPDALHYLGLLLSQSGKMEAALDLMQRSVALRPDVAHFHNNLGNAYRAAGLRPQALLEFREALRLDPQSATTLLNLGNMLLQNGQLDESLSYFSEALRQVPNLAEAHLGAGLAYKDLGLLDEALAALRVATELRPDHAALHSNLVYTLNFCPGYDAKAIYAAHRRWNQQFAEPLTKSIAPHRNERSAHRRLRIGYVSPDFRQHVVGRNLLPVLRHHDHRQFEIVCYSQVLRGDEVTACFQGCADVWRNIAGMNDEALANCIRQDRIDILVDLTMHMGDNRLLVFARKPAPVQICWLAYPGTTGLATIDYRITDPYLDPPGSESEYAADGIYADNIYSEQSFRLPETFLCYDPLASEPAVNPLPALETGHITFGCLNNFCKVNADGLKLWAQVLRGVDRSQLMILADEGSHRQRTLDLLEQEGVTSDRVTFVTKRPRSQYLELYHRIDIGLDTFPYNGHTTSLDSFWMGVPVVSLVGQTAVGRAGLCQLRNLGLPELIAYAPGQFVNIALELASDRSRLGELRANLRGRMQSSPLMDAPRFARNIEAAYREMWQRWCDS